MAALPETIHALNPIEQLPTAGDQNSHTLPGESHPSSYLSRDQALRLVHAGTPSLTAGCEPTVRPCVDLVVGI
jgi:hypothetical protein